MKRNLLKGALLALMVVATTVVFAQQTQEPKKEKPQQREQRVEMTPEEMAKKMSDKLVKSLELTSAQEKKVYAASLDYVKKIKESRELRPNYKAKLVGILTPEQTVKMFDNNGGQRGGQGGPRGGQGKAQQMQGGRPQGGKPQMAQGNKPQMAQGNKPQGEKAQQPQKRVEMTPEEKATKMTEKMVKSLELTEDQQKKVSAENLAFAKALQASRELKPKYQATLVGILTPEQTVKMFEQMSQRGGQGGPRGGQGKAPQMQGRKPQGGAQAQGQGQRPQRPQRPQPEQKTAETTATETK